MKTLLVGLDGSPRAVGVLAYAESLARLTGSKLLLLRSVGIPVEMEMAWPCSDEVLEGALQKQAQVYLDACADKVPEDLLGGVRVAVGIPWRVVCTAAREENANLIVIGSHGYSGIDHVLGTTAARIVNHADRPVLVLRGPSVSF